MQNGIFRRRRLPHWDVDDGTYFVTACLAGSIPAQGLLDLDRYRQHLAGRPRPSDVSVPDWESRNNKLVFARLDDWLDLRSAVRHLSHPQAADIVRDAIFHFAGTRYDLLAFVVMPSHIHWVFHPRQSWVDELRLQGSSQTPREHAVQSVHGFTARRCNQALGRTGAFWQGEAYDHVVRNESELGRIIAYIEQNPVKAGLVDRPEDWKWSSATQRHAQRLPIGGALLMSEVEGGF